MLPSLPISCLDFHKYFQLETFENHYQRTEDYLVAFRDCIFFHSPFSVSTLGLSVIPRAFSFFALLAASHTPFIYVSSFRFQVVFVRKHQSLLSICYVLLLQIFSTLFEPPVLHILFVSIPEFTLCLLCFLSPLYFFSILMYYLSRLENE